MSKQVQIRRGSSSNHASFTGAAGEITIDTTNNRIVVHDGTTAGGITGVKRTDVFSSAGYPTLKDPSNFSRLYADATNTYISSPDGDNIFYTSNQGVFVVTALSRTHLYAYDSEFTRLQDGSNNDLINCSTGNVTLGMPRLVSTATFGFPYIPQITGVPTTNPVTFNGFCPIAINTGNMRLYVHNQTGKWWFTNLTSS